MNKDLINLNPSNPRIIKDDKFKKLVQSLKDFPEMATVRPVVIDENSVILGGNMRYKAMIAAGWDDIPTTQVKGWTDEQKKEFIIKDNLSMGEWDYDILANEYDMKQLEDYGMDLPNGYDAEVEEDEAPEVDETSEPISKLGEVYQLGRHRLMCGDATKIEDVEKLMDGNKADMVFTDPPYGMKKEKDGVLNDNLSYSDLLKFNQEWVPLTISNLKENGSWYCWGIDEPLMDIYSNVLKPYIQENKMVFRNLITWDKGSGQGQNSDGTKSYATADEKCLFAVMGRFGTTINGEDYQGEWDDLLDYLQGEEIESGLSKKQMKDILGNMYTHYMTKSQFTLISEKKYEELQQLTGLYQKEYLELKRMYEEDKKRETINQFYFNNTHDNMNNVWHFERTSAQEREDTGEHATPKPIALCSRAIKSSSREEEIVLDVFGGSGSTLIACEQTNRICYMMELDPKYCDVIRKRYENYKS